LVAGKNMGAEGTQAPGGVAFLQIGAAHDVTQVEQDFGDAAHTDTADADEMNFMFLLQHENRFTAAALTTRHRVTLFDDFRRRVRPSHGPRRLRHALDAAAVAYILANLGCQDFTG
jgi:hypothetical protein